MTLNNSKKTRTTKFLPKKYKSDYERLKEDNQKIKREYKEKIKNLSNEDINLVLKSTHLSI